MTKLLHIFFIFTLLGVPACSSEADVSRSDLQGVSTADTRYYLGKTTVKSEQDEATDDILITRTTLQQDKVVKVQIYIWTDIQYVEKYHFNITPTGNNQFSLDGNYFQENVVGNGEVVGNIFGEWSQWTFEGSLPSDKDVRITSKSQLFPDGKMVNDADIFFKDDPLPIVTIDEVLYEKDPNDPEFAELLKKVLNN